MFKRIFTSALIFGMAALAPPVQAETTCASRQLVVAQLSLVYSEAPLVQGLSSPQDLVEFWANPRGGGWTLFVSRADGLACILATGTDWAPGPVQPASHGPSG